MRLFSCPNCHKRLYFENSICLSCGSGVRYDPHAAEFLLEGTPGVFLCANANDAACNWATVEGQTFCLACSLNQTIPDLSIEGNADRWIRVEWAKRQLIYALLALGLEVRPKQFAGEEDGITFDFLADTQEAGSGTERVLTGHDNGLITLNVAEAYSPEREKMRLEMGEPYRTLIGHFRHEIGHYYWDRLIRDDPQWLAEFRDLFGDETLDYAQALQDHYAKGAPADWQSRHISAYAASHPWEDWAESWAHYLHITDTLEMARAYNVPVHRIDAAAPLDFSPGYGASPSGDAAVDDMLYQWLRLSEASNAINRCMGLPDLYPFVISEPVASKLGYIHRLLEAKRQPVGTQAAA